MASNEYKATSNQASSSTINPAHDPNINSTILSSFTFNMPIKLTNNNYLLWRSQVTAIINVNELEDLINNTESPPNQVFINVNSNQIVITSRNPQFQI